VWLWWDGACGPSPAKREKVPEGRMRGRGMWNIAAYDAALTPALSRKRERESAPPFSRSQEKVPEGRMRGRGV